MKRIKKASKKLQELDKVQILSKEESKSKAGAFFVNTSFIATQKGKRAAD